MRANTTTKRTRILRRRQLALALVAAMATPAAMAQSACTSSTACLPVDGVVTSGTITASTMSGGKLNPYANQSDTTLTITQTTRGGIIDWGAFNIGSGHGLTFIQPANGVTLNRVVGFGYGFGGCGTVGGCAPTPSGINGSLSATGSVFIVNRAGITFNSTGTNQINVGGLIASTIDIADADFLAGVTSNTYRFRGQSGTGQVRNDGVINAAGGRVGFIGTDLQNDGTINALGGSVVFGAASSVTLDFLGDGLTQLTVNGLSAPDVVAMARNYGDINADGGQILMRALANPAGQGGVINGGTLRANTLTTRAGRVELTAPGGGVLLGDTRDGYLGPGIVDVSGSAAGLSGGSVWIDGANVVMASEPSPPGSPPSRIDASGDAGGGLVQIRGTTSLQMQSNTSINARSSNGVGGTVQIVTGNLQMQGDTGGSWIDASGTTGGGTIDARTGGALLAVGTSLSADGVSSGNGGTVNLQSTGGIVALGNISASAGKGGGDGGVVRILATSGALVGNVGARGSSDGDGGSVRIAASGGGALLFGSADVRGGVNGGSVLVQARDNAGVVGAINADGGADGGSVTLLSTTGTAILTETSDVSADGGTGTGGRVVLSGETGMRAYGAVSAHGGTGGGQVVTATDGELDIRGIRVDAGGASSAGLWTISAPELTVLSGSEAGEAATPATGTNVQDADLNFAMNTGTSLLLRSTDGSVNFDDAFVSTTSPLPLSFTVDSEDAITGNLFTIESTGGALAMAFNADANGDDADTGYIDFSGATLASNGGDILMYGGSNPASGRASGYASGIRLVGSSLDSGTGNVRLLGASTGSDAGADDAGVLLENTIIGATTGTITIDGLGQGPTNGVRFVNSFAGSESGALSVIGDARGSGDGIHFEDSSVATDSSAIVLRGTSAGGDGVEVIRPYTFNISDGPGLVIPIRSTSGDISITGDGATGGVLMRDTAVLNSSGAIAVNGTASGADTPGVLLEGTELTADGGGNVSVTGVSTNGDGIRFDFGTTAPSGVRTTTGAIMLDGTGEAVGLDASGGVLSTDSGDITLIGNAVGGSALAGVLMYSGSLATAGGDIRVDGTASSGIGVLFGLRSGFGMASGGGDIRIDGSGDAAGAWLQGGNVDSGGGNITVAGTASGTDGTGVALTDTLLSGTSGDVSVRGISAAGTGVDFIGKSGISTTTGAIGVTGVGLTVGLALAGGELTTDSGHFDLRGRGTGATSDGLLIGAGINIVTAGGGIELSGEGGSGVGVELSAGATVDAGNSLVVIRAGNDGSSDAVRIGGTIASGLGVNLRPGGVDANGGLTERSADEILVGGSTGFALSGAELAGIDAPELVIGSSLHAGAIRVLAATSRDGNLTLQNDAGNGGIDLQAALDVGGGVLALSSGGDITQAASGAITAHSLLARAGGDVLLAAAGNNVAANTLAGSSGGAFEYQDVDALAIGTVSAIGMDASSNGLSSMGASGIVAGGDVFVRNLAGDMTLNAGVSGADIDLVTANTLQNLAGASLVASGDWRVWANTWVGETRGGLAGDGNLPNLYGCAYLGQCGVTVPGTDNHFIYVQQPTALIAFDNFSREYGLPNPVLTFTVSGAILGDSAANVATGTGTTTATIGSNVGNYPILGDFTSAAGYRIQLVPGTLAITPASLLFTADSFIRYLGTDNPLFTGSITGFRNGDTVQSVFGSGVVWSSPAGLSSPIGFYPINGGSSAVNYVFTQAPGNATALQIIPLPQLSSTPIDLIRETVNTYVYDRNFGGAPMCALNASLEDQQLASFGDELSNEWSKVRSRPNLTNCFETERKNSCGDF